MKNYDLWVLGATRAGPCIVTKGHPAEGSGGGAY